MASIVDVDVAMAAAQAITLDNVCNPAFLLLCFVCRCYHRCFVVVVGGGGGGGGGGVISPQSCPSFLPC